MSVANLFSKLHTARSTICELMGMSYVILRTTVYTELRVEMSIQLVNLSSWHWIMNLAGRCEQPSLRLPDAAFDDTKKSWPIQVLKLEITV